MKYPALTPRIPQRLFRAFIYNKGGSTILEELKVTARNMQEARTDLVKEKSIHISQIYLMDITN